MADISRYTRPVEQTLDQYVPLPFEEMMKAGQAIQQRGDQAELQQAQVETGLGSMEALAPGYKNFVNKYTNDYKTQSGALLDKYGGNTSDPEFIRAAKKLNIQFASDPRLQTIKQGNDLIKNQQKIAQELGAKGVKFIDPNRGFTGVDQQGNLAIPNGSIRGTNFDEDITKAFMQIRDNIVDNGRGWKTNKPNLDKLAGNMINNLETNPTTKDAIDYYTQQGLSPEQARKATLGLVNQAYTDNLRTDRDYGYDQLQLAYRREAREDYQFKASLAAKLSAKKDQGMSGVVPEQSPIDPKDLNKDLIGSVDGVLKQLNSAGGLNKSQIQTIADTPENRKKYAGKFDTIDKYGPSVGTGAPGAKIGTELRLKNEQVGGNGSYNPEHLNVLKTAREQLGDLAKNGKNYLSDKTVLERYKDFLSKDNVAYTFWNTQSGDQLKQLDNLYVGTKGEKLGNATLIDSDGKKLKTQDKDFDMSKYDGFSFGGISAAPMEGFPNGAIKVNAVDKKGGKIVQFLKPLDAQMGSLFNVSNKGYKALMSGKTNADIAKDNSLWLNDPETPGGVLVPQKEPNGGINLYKVDPKTGRNLGRSNINWSEQVAREHQDFTTYLQDFSNKG